jgi:Na+/H+-translocating membrane pyrophosphatase
VTDDGEIDTSVNKKVVEISDAIARGARAFLLAEYKYMFIFLVVFGILRAARRRLDDRGRRGRFLEQGRL